MPAIIQTSFFSTTPMKTTNVNILYPKEPSADGWELPEAYPVLYLLHGMGDDECAWLRFSSIMRYAERRRVIIVMPDAQQSFYTDMSGLFRYETYLTQELPEFLSTVLRRFSRRREHTYIAGLSMGGYGAVRIGLRFGERYSKIASLSGVFRLSAAHRDWVPEAYWNLVFGNRQQMDGSAHDMLAYAPQAAGGMRAEQIALPELFLCCGRQDSLYPDYLALRGVLSAAGYPLTCEEGDGGHEWAYWDAMIVRVLDWIGV